MSWYRQCGYKPVCTIWDSFLPVSLKLYSTPGSDYRESAVLEAMRVALCHKEGVFYLGQETYCLCPLLTQKVSDGAVKTEED